MFQPTHLQPTIPVAYLPEEKTRSARFSVISTRTSLSSFSGDEFLITPCATPPLSHVTSPSVSRSATPPLPTPPDILPSSFHADQKTSSTSHVGHYGNNDTVISTHAIQTVSSDPHSAVNNPFKELMYAPMPGKEKGNIQCEIYEDRECAKTRMATNSGGPDRETLWARMLLVQMCCGVYNSARLNAAIETGEFEKFMRELSFLFLVFCPVLFRYFGKNCCSAHDTVVKMGNYKGIAILRVFVSIY